MEDNKKRNLMWTLVLFGAFVIYTVCVKFVDVAPIGPEGSSVGFSGLNKAIHDLLGYNEFFYLISKILGLFAIMFMGMVALIALWQVIQRKSLFKADRCYYVIGVFYVIVLIVYLFFEVCIVNFRPVILDEGLEASYPSSHTVLAISVFLSGAIWFKRIISREMKTFVPTILYAFTFLMVVSRLISGVHWFTDIIGGVVGGAFLTSLYMTMVSYFENADKQKKD
ncbi:MAG: phosphatase PAP2 family protein [Lachnospiraceae bacterium]|nr:phosphatase PAP2 family protein [Lachnospiraceae bacterium]